MTRSRTRAALAALAVSVALVLAGPARAGGAQGPARGAWLELRLVESAPAGTFDSGTAVALAQYGRAVGDTLPESPGPSTFVAGYRFGRLTLSLGLNYFHDNASRPCDEHCPGPSDGLYVLFLGPVAAWAVIPPRVDRPSLYIEAAFHGLLTWTSTTSGRTQGAPGYGIRLAAGSRAFVLPWLALGLEGGAEYDWVLPSSGSPKGSRDIAFGFYGALTVGVVVD